MGKYVAVIVLVVALGAVEAASAAPCAAFKWDVSQELALFAGQPQPLPAGKNAATAPNVAVDRLYGLTLVPQSQVNFAMAPGRNTDAGGAFAGLAQIELPAPGNYRVSVDVPLWIDVVADGRLAEPTDFQGQHSCEGPHKIVEFDLTGARRFVLQLSGSGDAAVRMTITRTPQRKL